MKKKTKGQFWTQLFFHHQNNNNNNKKNWSLCYIFLLYLGEGHETLPHVPTVYTKPVGRDERPDLEAKARLGARLNGSVIIMAFGGKNSVELSPLCEDVRLSLALPMLLEWLDKLSSLLVCSNFFPVCSHILCHWLWSQRQPVLFFFDFSASSTRNVSWYLLSFFFPPSSFPLAWKTLCY